MSTSRSMSMGDWLRPTAHMFANKLFASVESWCAREKGHQEDPPWPSSASAVLAVRQLSAAAPVPAATAPESDPSASEDEEEEPNGE